MDSDEATYLQLRSRQLAERAGLRRRDVLRLGAALPLAAGVARLAGPTTARAAEAAASSPILKPLPPEWFVKLRLQRRDALGTRSAPGSSPSAVDVMPAGLDSRGTKEWHNASEIIRGEQA